ncbi:unnamed protein product, partial [Timema podura]|nr:unnamed protein product [Timema podura]
MSSNSTQVRTKVSVVRGSPPVIRILPDPRLVHVNPADNATVQAEVSGLRECCRLEWSVVEEPGYHFFDLSGLVGLGDAVTLTVDETHELETKEALDSKEFPLIVPGPIGKWPGLLGDSRYKLRLSASCPVCPNTSPTNKRAVESHADVVIATNSPPEAQMLQVTPSEGEALLTRFTFSTRSASDSLPDFPLQYRYGYKVGGSREQRDSGASDSLPDFPLQYRYGYKVGGSREQRDSGGVVHVFSTSSTELEAVTLLPASGKTRTGLFYLPQAFDLFHSKDSKGPSSPRSSRSSPPWRSLVSDKSLSFHPVNMSVPFSATRSYPF